MRTGRSDRGMQTSRGRHAPARRASDMGPFLYRNRLLLLLFMLLLLGELIGSFMMRGTELSASGTLPFLTQGFLAARGEQSLLETFTSSLSSSALLMLPAFLLGFCAIAQPVIVFLPLFRGLGLGLSMAYLYAAYGWRGVFACLVLILPNAVLSSLAILMACREALRMSALFLSCAFGTGSPPADPEGEPVPYPAGGRVDMRLAFRLYLVKFALLLGVAVAASLVDSVFTFLFAGMLSL